MTFENLVPNTNPGIYQPKIFGFKVHHTSSSLCQIGSKRMIPPDNSQTSSSLLSSSSSSSSNQQPIQNVNGRRSSLPFLDDENEDESDGEIGPSYPPSRLFSPVTLSPHYGYNYPHLKQLQQQHHQQQQLQLHFQRSPQNNNHPHHHHHHNNNNNNNNQHHQNHHQQHHQQHQQQQQQQVPYSPNSSYSNQLQNSPTIEYSASFLRGIKRDSSGGELINRNYDHNYSINNTLSQSSIPPASLPSTSSTSSTTSTTTTASTTSTSTSSTSSTTPTLQLCDQIVSSHKIDAIDEKEINNVNK